MLPLPTKIEDIQKLIDQEIPEDIHLDYKLSPAIEKFDEMAKDVSAFANSDGGLLIYGVEEDKSSHKPVRMDAGIDHKKFDRERIENILTSRITPRIDDLFIKAIPISEHNSLYAIQVPKSHRGPHQAPDKKYYKRFNFKAEAMEDYEIQDVRNRRQTLQPLLSIEAEVRHGVMAVLIVENIGELPATDVTFEFSEKLVWHNNRPIPVLFRRGAKYIPPGKCFRYFYNEYTKLFEEGTNIPSSFDVSISYTHPQINQQIRDTFHIDLKDYESALVTESEIRDFGRTLKEAITALTSEVQKVNKSISTIASIADSTGLGLSVTTLRNLKHLKDGTGKIEKIDPYDCDYRVFKEVLDIDDDLGLKLQNFFFHPDPKKKLQNLPGITEEILEKIKLHFTSIDESLTETQTE